MGGNIIYNTNLKSVALKLHPPAGEKKGNKYFALFTICCLVVILYRCHPTVEDGLSAWHPVPEISWSLLSSSTCRDSKRRDQIYTGGTEVSTWRQLFWVLNHQYKFWVYKPQTFSDFLPCYWVSFRTCALCLLSKCWFKNTLSSRLEDWFCFHSCQLGIENHRDSS